MDMADLEKRASSKTKRPSSRKISSVSRLHRRHSKKNRKSSRSHERHNAGGRDGIPKTFKQKWKSWLNVQPLFRWIPFFDRRSPLRHATKKSHEAERRQAETNKILNEVLDDTEETTEACMKGITETIKRMEGN